MPVPLLRRTDPETIRIDLVSGPVEVKVKRNSRAKNYTLRIPHASDGPVLTLPARGSLVEGQRFLLRQRGWLERKLATRPKARAVEPGAVVPIRGADHRLVHKPGLRGAARIEAGLDGPLLVVGGEPEHMARRVADFLKREAKRDLEAAVIDLAGRIGVRPVAIRLRDTRSRWGSCSSKRSLSFSWRLIMAPPFVLRSLAAHEVAHLKEMNHGPRFWRLVAALDPEWKTADAWLRRNGAALHAVVARG